MNSFSITFLYEKYCVGYCDIYAFSSVFLYGKYTLLSFSEIIKVLFSFVLIRLAYDVSNESEILLGEINVISSSRSSPNSISNVVSNSFVEWYLLKVFVSILFCARAGFTSSRNSLYLFKVAFISFT